jgi:hypothetical protein
MKLPLLALSALAVFGCAPRTFAAFVPRLVLRLDLARQRDAHGDDARAEQTHALISAQLRWQPSWRASYAGPSSTLVELAPCDVADARCAIELLASEPELAALMEVP